MLSGLKYIPRDQLLQQKKRNSGQDGDDEEERRKKSGSKSKKIRRKEKKETYDRHSSESSSADDDDDRVLRREKRMKKRRRKKWYSSDDDGGSRDGSLVNSQSRSESLVDSEEDDGFRRGRRKELLEDSYSSDVYEKDKKRSKKKNKKGNERRERKGKVKRSEKEFSDDGGGDDRELVQKEDKGLARKELGLEWMLHPSNKSHETSATREEETKTEEVLRTNSKELNPYFKDNGSGYPDDAATSATANKLLSSSLVGDGGASWRLKALKRAKEQAAREGKKLDEVVEERWSSLGELAASVASSRVAAARAHFHAIRDRKRGQIESSEAVPSGEIKGGSEKLVTGSHEYLHDVSSRNLEMRKPRQESLSWKRNKGHNMSSEDKSLISAALSSLNKFPNDGSFMDKVADLQNQDAGFSTTPSSSASLKKNDHLVNKLSSSKDKDSDAASLTQKQVLNENQLAAKILQLRMKGKHEEAEKLSKKMEAILENQDAGIVMNKQDNEEVLRRFTRKQMASEQKRSEEDADLHLAKMIVKNKQYSLSGREEDEYGFDVAPGKKRNRRREEVSEERISIPKRLLTQQERCQFCFENPSRPRHLVVSIANFTYLMLPQWQPVVAGHCCILPMQHEASTRTIDKNVWEEIRNFKKCLLKMFAAQEKTLVFIETVIGLAKQRRHCLLECIPVPFERADLAPMYFRKAIEEAEGEWGQHEMKKVIPTSGNLRQVVPENFSYFHVEFGLDKGFVHAIDEDGNFNSGFGLNVVRGLLRLPEEDMYRRRRHEPMEKQKQAVAIFAQQWEPFDWTKDL